MATFSDGGNVFVDSGLPPSGDLRFYLQSLLDGKEKQLQQAGTLGQQLLAQRMELEERVRQLQEMDLDVGEDDFTDAGIRDKYRELAETIKAWDAENETLSDTFISKPVNGVHNSPPSRSLELSRGDLERSLERSKAVATGTSATQSSRRAKNAAHRADDVEFAFEIGSGLLTEVRRLQSLLGERDKAIQDMKEEKDDLDKSLENLRTALRSQEQSSDKYKEENWNLEVTLQELRTNLADSQATTQRLEGEQKRLTRLLTSTREATDQHKNDAEKHQVAYEELKAKHETDIAQARKHAASLQRDKSDLQQSLDSMKVELSKGSKRLPRFGSPLTPNGGSISELGTPMGVEEDDVFSAASTNKKKGDTSTIFPIEEELGDFSPEPSPSKPFLAPNHPTNEIEVLQRSLAHAQRQINTLKGTLQREKELRLEYRRKLQSSPGAVPNNDEDEDEEDDDFVDEDAVAGKPKARLTPYRSSGRGRGRVRGRGGLTLMQRFNMAAQSPSSEFGDDDIRESSPPPPVPAIPIEYLDEDDTLQKESYVEEETEVQHSPSPQAISNRTSVDGMDPAFANVLRRSASANSIPPTASPLRQSVVPRPVRGGTLPRRRGGAAYQEVRPPSLVGQPEALAAELGFGMIPSMENTLELPEVETAEFGCQADFQEPLPAPIVIVQPPPPSPPPPTPPAVSEIGIQVDPEPIPVVVKSDFSGQTEAEVHVLRTDSAVQHEDLTPVPSRSEAEVQTIVLTSADADTQTLPLHLPSPPSKVTAETETQTSPIFLSHQDSPREVLLHASNSFGEFNVEDTITPRPAPIHIFDESDYEDDGTQTETGSMFHTETEDYEDARQTLATPTESLDDFHSIHTATDRDFSDDEDDDESIKVSRVSSRIGPGSAMSSTLSIPIMNATLPEPPALTYESKGVSAEIIVELPPPPPPAPEVEKPPPEPKPELVEISIQTDEWLPPPPPPAPLPVVAPIPTPSPTLFRVGPPSQQFQFISPPPSAGPTTTQLPISATPSPNTTITRDSLIPVPIPRPRTSQSDRRQSIESTLSTAMEELSRSRTPSNVVDKSRPPMMVLPPPPKAPPPPNSMPPPQFVPERRFPSTASHEIPPPRPLSPPPPELIQRATTPTFGAVLSVPGRPFGLRQHGSSLPPQSGIRQPPSTSSFRSAANAAARAQASPLSPTFGLKGERREMSSTSLGSNGHSLGSQRSSISSDHHAYEPSPNRLPQAPVTPERPPEKPMHPSGSTDPTVIHAITQTMIGEFLYKYTRRAIGKGHGERRHKRFFWVHPYTRTLYWSSADPGSSGVSESSAKSAYIESVRQVLDPNPMPPGIYQYSVVVSTPQREMKFTAPTRERHDIWLNALQFLLSRPGPSTTVSPGNGAALPNSPKSIDQRLHEEETSRDHNPFSSPQSQRSARTTRTGLSTDSWNVTPRGQKSQSQISLGGSVSKRAGTPAAEYLRWGGAEVPQSPTKSFEHIPGNDDGELDFELNEDTLSDDGFEGLENVRACCDGRHTVGRSGKIEHHHHHHHNTVQGPPPSRTREQHLDPNPFEVARPVSPAWSFRSTTSEKEGTGFFSRFGSRRSTKTVPTVTAASAHNR